MPRHEFSGQSKRPRLDNVRADGFTGKGACLLREPGGAGGPIEQEGVGEDIAIRRHRKVDHFMSEIAAKLRGSVKACSGFRVDGRIRSGLWCISDFEALGGRFRDVAGARQVCVEIDFGGGEQGGAIANGQGHGVID